MAFFQKNIGNFLHRLSVFFIFSQIRFNLWGRHLFALKHAPWDQTHSLSGKNGVQEGQIHETDLSLCSWPIIHPEADVGHFAYPQQSTHCACPNRGLQSEGLTKGVCAYLGAQCHFFGDNHPSQVLSSQGSLSPLCANHENHFNGREDGMDLPLDVLAWGTDQKKCDVFGILREQSDGACGLLLQKRIRTSWYS